MARRGHQAGGDSRRVTGGDKGVRGHSGCIEGCTTRHWQGSTRLESGFRSRTSIIKGYRSNRDIDSRTARSVHPTDESCADVETTAGFDYEEEKGKSLRMWKFSTEEANRSVLYSQR